MERWVRRPLMRHFPNFGLQKLGLGPTKTSRFKRQGAKQMFINCSNHPSLHWSKEQKEAAEKLGYGPVVDVKFPQVDPKAGEWNIQELASDLCKKITGHNAKGVFISGEFTLTFATILRLQEAGLPCYAACSERTVQESINSDGTTQKNVVFKFMQWRKFTPNVYF